jgi:hypothetical protein
MMRLTDAPCRYDKCVSYLKIIFCKDFDINLLTGTNEMTVLQSSFPSTVTAIKNWIYGKGRYMVSDIWRRNRRCHSGCGDADVIYGLCSVAPKAIMFFAFNSPPPSGITSSVVSYVHILLTSEVHHVKQNFSPFSNYFCTSNSTDDFVFLFLDLRSQDHGLSLFFSYDSLALFCSPHSAIL